MGFFLERTPRANYRELARLRAYLVRLALVLDAQGRATAPITLLCSPDLLPLLGLSPYRDGSFLFGMHPVSAADSANGVRSAVARRREGLAAFGPVPCTGSRSECKPGPNGDTHNAS